MKKTSSNVISFPKPRRKEQTGLTHRAFPGRWLGALLMTTVGAAWALSPANSSVTSTNRAELSSLDSMVAVGEPQVVAQVLGSVVGPSQIPQRELRALSAQGGSENSVVVTRRVEPLASTNNTDFLKTVESLESEFSSSGQYPAICSTDKDAQEVTYKSNGRRFELTSGELSYDSAKGFVSAESEDDEVSQVYGVTALLESVTEGWGPWKSEKRNLVPTGARPVEELRWLEGEQQPQSWSCRLYFPISAEQTGQFFRKADGKSAYRAGELHYDGVSGTFQLKLHRAAGRTKRALSPLALEAALVQASGCELVGQADLLADLGLLAAEVEGDKVVKLQSTVPLSFSGQGELDSLRFSALKSRVTELKAGNFLSQDSESEASVAGHLDVVDKLGQLHSLRVRAGRGVDYDWVVGQLCPVECQSEDLEVQVTQAYDDAFNSNRKSSVIAGE